MTKLYILNGFDRVGKGTIIENTLSVLPSGTTCIVKHWGAPLPGEDAFGRYWEWLYEGFDDVDYVFFDRSFMETFFFEVSRKHNSVVNIDDVKRLTKFYLQSFSEFYPIVVKRDWDLIKTHHQKEIEDNFADFKSGETLNLEERRKEYNSYYTYFERLDDFLSPICNLLWLENHDKETNLIDNEHIREKNRT